MYNTKTYELPNCNYLHTKCNDLCYLCHELVTLTTK